MNLHAYNRKFYFTKEIYKANLARITQTVFYFATKNNCFDVG